MSSNNNFDFTAIENKWKKYWAKVNLYEAVDFSQKPKKYILAEFPYPSGKSIHVGHAMRYTMPEIYSRFLRMSGYNVMFPMGWDAFGLPAENYAVKTGIHPAETTEKLITDYRHSMMDMGYGIDWEREVNSTDPGYYKWTQWIFLKFYEAGLAELREEPVWWSPHLKTVLAEEEVEKDAEGNLVAERDGSPVERKLVRQWVLKITEYADTLFDGLDDTDFPSSVVEAQRNWIGRSYGAQVKFDVVGEDGSAIDGVEDFEVYTTRVDTIFGVSFMVIAPEHEYVAKLIENAANKDEIQAYVDSAKAKTELARQQDKVKTGVRIEGVYCVNPADPDSEMGSKIPVFVADYVLAGYGTGIVMGVAAHDERDYEFAEKYELPIVDVIELGQDGERFGITGKAINSGEFDGLATDDAKEAIIEKLEKEGKGEKKKNFKIRDWIFSRQRYWGEPIPLLHKEDGTIEAVVHTSDVGEGNDLLPLELPEVEDFKPTDDGNSPLTTNTEWINAKTSDGSNALRETNTMPNWAGSCWYYLRYIDPKNSSAFADQEKMKYWLPVDHYFGGSEHTTLHLLYSRFWHRFLHDNDLVPTPEPYAKRTNGGILLAEDGTKMSKSKGNVINPGEKVNEYGADAVRMYITFLGPYDGTFPYNESSLKRCHKVIADVWALKDNIVESIDDSEALAEINSELHKFVRNVTEMAENLKMNTIVSQIMVFVTYMKGLESLPVAIWRDFLKVFGIYAVFTAEQLWQESFDRGDIEDIAKEDSLHLQDWPVVNEDLIIENVLELPVQINGKVRGRIEVAVGSDEANVREAIENDEFFIGQIDGKEIKKFIYVEGKIVNLIV